VVFLEHHAGHLWIPSRPLYPFPFTFDLAKKRLNIHSRSLSFFFFFFLFEFGNFSSLLWASILSSVK
jgi:hypothetical protein